MLCSSCNAENQAEFTAEVYIHLPSPHNLGNPGVLFVPTLLVCLDCGSTQFTIPRNELELIARGTPVGACQE